MTDHGGAETLMKEFKQFRDWHDVVDAEATRRIAALEAELDCAHKLYQIMAGCMEDSLEAEEKLEAALKVARAASNWALHLIHGVGKGGGGPETNEHIGCAIDLEDALKAIDEALGE